MNELHYTWFRTGATPTYEKARFCQILLRTHRTIS